MMWLVTFLEDRMKGNLHNYGVASLLALEWVVVLWVMIAPQDLRLQMAKDVGTVLIGLLGIVAGTHGAKAVATTWKGNGGSPGTGAPPAPDPRVGPS